MGRVSKRTKRVNKSQCRTCLYKTGYRQFEIHSCSYIILTGHSRRCDPSPNCTAYKRYNKKERAELEKKAIDKNNW